MSEKINHPSHYQREGGKECIEEMRENYGDLTVFIFCLTNAYKYIYRAGKKEDNSKEQDLGKARWYIEYAKNIYPHNIPPFAEIKYKSLVNDVVCKYNANFVSKVLEKGLGKVHNKDNKNYKNIDLWGDTVEKAIELAKEMKEDENN